MFYPPFDTKQVKFFLFIKLKSAILIPLGQQLIPTEGGNFFRHLLRNCYLSLREKLALCAISKGFPFVRKLSAVG